MARAGFLAAVACAALLPAAPVPAAAAAPRGTVIAETTWVDHDRQPIRRPPDWDRSFWGRRFHQAVTEPIAHVFDIPDKLIAIAHFCGAPTRREAVDVNAFDEVPNSSWFTNRNLVRAVPVAELRQGPDAVLLPARPWTIRHRKQGGWSAGFQIQDAAGRKWLVKLDTRGHPQLSSGADMVARTLLHAAGYNVPHNEPVRFTRADLEIDPALLRGTKGERFTEADLDSMLGQGARLPDGTYLASASLFLDGLVLGPPNMARRRRGDANDWYLGIDRRELRGLYPICSWLDDWDTEDHQFLELFVETRDSLGHVEHVLLDAGSSLGASATGPKEPWEGYENAFDLRWIGLRIVTLGFVQEPWRRARPETGLPAVGRFESAAYAPRSFRTLVPQPAFQRMTDRDGYWGAKIVASFSDAQIAAAVASAHYDDPRASEYLVRTLVARRDRVARCWFARVAPLDFFSVEGGSLRFHDLAVDLGLAGARAYDLRIEAPRGRVAPARLRATEWPLPGPETGVSRVAVVLSVAGDRARPARVELERTGSAWTVTRVRHG